MKSRWLSMCISVGKAGKRDPKDTGGGIWSGSWPKEPGPRGNISAERQYESHTGTKVSWLKLLDLLQFLTWCLYFGFILL